MLYRISNFKAPLSYSVNWLGDQVHALLGQHVKELKVTKESVDARKSSDLCFVLQLEVITFKQLKYLPRNVVPIKSSCLDIADPPALSIRKLRPHQPVVVVGAGPAGYFAALVLAESGVKTILLERGKPVETRMRDIGQLRSHGRLDPESNICFGEGGAGAYTDGKLYTRIKHPYARWVMKRFIDFQAPAEILIKSHPHLGTDKLVRIVKRMREHLTALAVEIRFGTRLLGLIRKDGQLTGLRLADGEVLPATQLVLAIGHSARDTLSNLNEDGVFMEAKPFAVGVRAEHPQALVDRQQYGDIKHKAKLGAASYSFTHQVNDPFLKQRGVYSFCMCPGGFIVPSQTELERMAINGMSNANRSTAFANSGVVVQVTPEDLARHGFAASPLMCISFQRALEEACFKATDRPYAAAAMRISDFVARRATGKLAPTNFRPQAEAHDLWQILPSWITTPLCEALNAFNCKFKGYTSAESNILAVESRTSSPIRITRNQHMQSINTAGLFPVGEGSGYAGGIVSAAVDGVKAAERIVSDLRDG